MDFPYQTDPHATYIGHTDRYERLMQKEIGNISDGKLDITTQELYEDNKKYPLAEFSKKTIPVSYANIRQIEPTQLPKTLKEGKINCIYAAAYLTIAFAMQNTFLK